MALISYFNFRWNVKAWVKAGIAGGGLPFIGHYFLWLRDLLCDVVAGTGLKDVQVAKEWPRLDLRKKYVS